jgi:hypothetical protein
MERAVSITLMEFGAEGNLCRVTLRKELGCIVWIMPILNIMKVSLTITRLWDMEKWFII